MAAPVWVLSVDLQTKTASFTTGLADAAQKARGAFADIKSSAKEGGDAVSKSSINAQQALGVLTNALRGDTENAFADIIREMSHTSVVMTALPFAAAAGGALLLVNTAVEVAQKIREWREEQEKLVNEQTRFGTTINETFGSLDDRLLQAQQRADELRNDHLGALQKQLELIDRASMRDLVHEFETLSKAAEGTFKLLESHWYAFGIGSAGAQHALEQFKLQYDSLLAQDKGGAAADLLKGTRESAEKVLEAQKAMQGSVKDNGIFGKTVDYEAQFKARAVLQAAGVGYSDKELKSQQAIVDALRAQTTVQDKLNAIKNQDSSNAKTTVGNDASAQRSAAAAQAAQSQMAIQEQLLAADKAYADAALTMQQATVEKRLASDLDFTQRDYAIKLQANAAAIAALNKSGKDYENQLKALQEKRLELDAQHDAAVAGLRSRADIEQYQRDLANLQQSEREKIQATQQGSAERLAAIDAALKEAQARGQQDTDYYRQLNSQRVDTVRQGAEQELQSRLNTIQAQERTDEQGIQAQARIDQMKAQSRNASIQTLADIQTQGENTLYDRQRIALEQQLEALQQSGTARVSEVQRVQQQIESLTQSHTTKVNEIQAQADVQRVTEFSRAMVTMESQAAGSAIRILSGQQSFTSVMSGLANQLTQNVIQAGIARLNGQRSEQLGNAKTAASNVYAEVSGWPVVGPFLAPVLAGSAFAAVLAFNKGGRVPGIGNTDTVPASLTPGEHVIDKRLTDMLTRTAQGSDGGSGGSTTHIHVRPTYNLQALDGAGIERTLKNHTNTLTKHFNAQVRRMNK